MTHVDDIALARLTLPDDRPHHDALDAPPLIPRSRVLLLQGPVGPFMGHLRCSLQSQGMETCQVVFNLADLLFAGRSVFGPHVRVYTGKERVWRSWLRRLVTDWRPDVVVLFGCERMRHVVARKLCRQMGIPVLSLEEGYVRPGYVSAEWGGNNRCSPLASLPERVIANLADRPVPEAGAGREFNAMAWWGFLYYVARFFGRPFFPHAVHHKRRPLVSETAFWLRSVWRKATRYIRNRDMVDGLVEHERGRFYVVPLQVRDDMQLAKAARGWTNERLIEEAIASFAAHAPSDRHLVFKVHPLERGHSDAFTRVRESARRHQISERVCVVDDGSIGLLTSASAGMVTINSTSAFSALLRGVPLGVVGEAIYRRDDLAFTVTDRNALDRFWTEAEPAVDTIAVQFRKAVMATALVPGDFYRAHNRDVAASAIAERLVAGISVAREREAARMRASARAAMGHSASGRRGAALPRPRIDNDLPSRAGNTAGTRH